MYYFKQMIELANKKGVQAPPSAFAGSELQAMGKLFFQSLERAHSFVFTPQGGEPTEVPEHLCDATLDLPFPVVSLEMLGQAISIPRHDDIMRVSIYCLLVIEYAPKKHTSFALVEANDKRGVMLLQDGMAGGLIASLLERLKTSKIGVESTRERIKTGQGTEKRTITLRKIVHVVPKSLMESYRAPSGKSIEWSHRWSVRGHWRKVPGLGKNREGDYCVEGFTWISDFVKGPENAPLVPKTRLVKS